MNYFSCLRIRWDQILFLCLILVIIIKRQQQRGKIIVMVILIIIHYLHIVYGCFVDPENKITDKHQQHLWKKIKPQPHICSEEDQV